MESGCAPQFIERQALDSGKPERLASPQLRPRCTNVQGFAAEAHAGIIFDAFVNAVERLEGLVDKETMMLIEHQPIALDDFNHKKRHLRKIAERTVAGLMCALETCADIFKPAECENYFNACGYDTG
jgi:hypothetical protein